MDVIFRNFPYEPTENKTEEDRDTEDTRITELKIEQAILAFGRRVRAFDGWRSGAGAQSRWSSFPSQAQNAIREIENDDSFEWERRYLDRLINPDDVEEGWSEIALEPDIKEAIQ